MHSMESCLWKSRQVCSTSSTALSPRRRPTRLLASKHSKRSGRSFQLPKSTSHPMLLWRWVRGQRSSTHKTLQPLNFPVSCFSTQFELFANETEVKNTKHGIQALSKIMKSSNLSVTPYFFSLTTKGQPYNSLTLAAAKEEDRNRWIKAIKSATVRLQVAKFFFFVMIDSLLTILS